MFQNEELKNHLENSSVIRMNSAVIAEWNMNVAENILQTGNYRYRSTEDSGSIYSGLSQSFSPTDEANFYTGATDADIVVDGGIGIERSIDEDGIVTYVDTPQLFKTTKQKENLLYSLEDCFGRFRPRSGINKLRYFENKYSHYTNPNMSLRPRYYMADKNDKFKYWTSYRTEDGIERGIANKQINNQYHIDDAAPFVVYKDPVPANRIVIKMQTHIGTASGDTFYNNGSSFADPFTGQENSATPVKWKIQYLKNDNWLDIAIFDENSIRLDGSPIIGPDGYVEMVYGPIIPEKYHEFFNYIKELSSSSLLPPTSSSDIGDAYLIKSNQNDQGIFYVYNGEEFESFAADYGWYLDDSQPHSLPRFVKDMVNSPTFVNEDGEVIYREFQYLNGLRIAATTMNVFDATLDLIELSPRLVADLSDKVESFSLKKSASDLGVTGLPVGQLLASVGSVNLFDYDQAFLEQNTSSIISQYLSQNIQIKLYEVIFNNNKEYRVPIKTMYTEGFPQITSQDRAATLALRDLFFYFESISAPEVLIQNASLSYAISTMLDSMGFSNYIFYRVEGEDDPIIPFFFVEPDVSVAEILERLATSTQTAMFFDEYNNFVCMSKNYILPEEDQRSTDITLRGSSDQSKSGPYKNATSEDSAGLANIEQIAFQDNEVYNDGVINFTTRYIQRSFNSVRNYFDLDRDKTWTYKPSLLWEVSATEKTKSINEEVEDQSGYALTAIPLNSDLTDEVPYVANNQIQNNIIDLGDGIRWIARYNGYFYANGEIIRYDAVQYSIPGLSARERDGDNANGDSVWISSIQEYQKYFAKIPFGGKMYPTGSVRIYTQPNYEVLNDVTRLRNGEVAKHGRGQFGTEITNHSAGIDSNWTNPETLKGCVMDSTYLFSNVADIYVEAAESFNDFIQLDDVSGISPGFVIEIIEGIGALEENTRVISVNNLTNQIRVSPEPLFKIETTYIDLETLETKPSLIRITDRPLVIRSSSPLSKAAGIDSSRILTTTRSGTISNIFAKQYTEEVGRQQNYSGNLQASALIMSGSTFSTAENPLNFISYSYKELSDRYRHFGTRLRIIGKLENNVERGQSPTGVGTYYTVLNTETQQSSTIGGASGGIGIMVNPNTNNGYFFEIAALTESNIAQYENVDNIYFYKVSRRADVEGAEPVENGDPAIPVKLWGSKADILVDDGSFTGQSRVAGEKYTTVYDLAVEYEDISNGSIRRFYLYVNNVLVGIVDDEDPLEEYNNMALFNRGSSTVMFENIYALGHNYSKEKSFSLGTPVNSVFTQEEVTANTSLQKYALSGMIQSTYLKNILPSEGPDHKIYFEEFGTIMREAAYFNIKYDKAYPALSAKIAPTYGSIKGYTVSGFLSTPYGAEFLIFNATDNAIALDATTGNYLRILGVTFTQESEEKLTVDEYFSKVGDLSRPRISGSQVINSPLREQKDYQDIIFNRMTQGNKSFSLSAPYIQSKDSAEDMMSWLTSKIMKPRKSVGLTLFGLPTLQLGDIVNIDYQNTDGVNEVSDISDRFVVYHIDYDKTPEGLTMTTYLSEVT